MAKGRAQGGRKQSSNVKQATKTFNSKKSSDSKTKKSVGKAQRQAGGTGKGSF